MIRKACLLLSALFIPLTSALAQTVITTAFDNFSGSNSNLFQVNNSASISAGNLVLTPEDGGVGSAFFKNKVTLLNNRSFSAYFDFVIDRGACFGPDISADGLAFVIQTQSSSAGSGGGGIGYQGITPSTAVEFDTFDNGVGDNNSGNHIGIAINGDVSTALTTGIAEHIGVPFDSEGMNPAVNQAVWIDYDGATSTMEVRHAPWSGGNRPGRPASASVTYTFTAGSTLADIFSSDVFVGFTAATGGCIARHQVLSFYFNNDLVAGGIEPLEDTYTSAPAAVTLASSEASIVTGEETTLTATVLDLNENPVASQSVNFTSSIGTLSSATALTDVNGNASVVLQSSTSGTADIRASVEGGAFADVSVAVIQATPTPTATPTAVPDDRCPLTAPTLTRRGRDVRVNFQRKGTGRRDYRIILKKVRKAEERRTRTKSGQALPFFKNLSKGKWSAQYLEIRRGIVVICSKKTAFTIR